MCFSGSTRGNHLKVSRCVTTSPQWLFPVVLLMSSRVISSVSSFLKSWKTRCYHEIIQTSEQDFRKGLQELDLICVTCRSEAMRTYKKKTVKSSVRKAERDIFHTFLNNKLNKSFVSWRTMRTIRVCQPDLKLLSVPIVRLGSIQRWCKSQNILTLFSWRFLSLFVF